MTWLPIIAFLFTVLILIQTDFRYFNEQEVTLIHAIGIVVLLAYPTIALGVLIFGIIATRVHSKIRWSAVVYWTWWPFFRLVMCCLAVVLGTALGNYLWYHQFLRYTQLQRLQAYQNIDPYRASGVRLQDAGIATFNRNATVDRLRTGCTTDGATYCIAPIVPNGKISLARDLFMVGVDCCACPGEFRCGDWNVPGELGGMRVVDDHDRQFYRVAAEKWSATYGPKLRHPIFLRWETEPLDALRELQERGRRLLALGLLATPGLFYLLAVALNGLLGLLVELGHVAPVEVPAPTQGIGGQEWGPGPPKEPLQWGAAPPDPKYVCL